MPTPAGSNLILHAADIYHPSVLDRLERIAPVRATTRTGDEDRCVADPRLCDSLVYEALAWRIGRRHRIVYPEMRRCFGGAVASNAITRRHSSPTARG